MDLIEIKARRKSQEPAQPRDMDSRDRFDQAQTQWDYKLRELEARYHTLTHHVAGDKSHRPRHRLQCCSFHHHLDCVCQYPSW
jgi:hypothetical protein